MGLTTAECEEAAWAITPDRALHKGAAAINIVLDRIFGELGLFSMLYSLAWMQRLQDRAYQWVAEHRSHFPGVTPAIDWQEPWQPTK